MVAMVDEIDARAAGELDRFEKATRAEVCGVFDAALDDLLLLTYREFFEWEKSDPAWQPTWARFLGLITARRQLAITALSMGRADG